MSNLKLGWCPAALSGIFTIFIYVVFWNFVSGGSLSFVLEEIPRLVIPSLVAGLVIGLVYFAIMRFLSKRISVMRSSTSARLLIPSITTSVLMAIFGVFVDGWRTGVGFGSGKWIIGVVLFSTLLIILMPIFYYLIKRDFEKAGILK